MIFLFAVIFCAYYLHERTEKKKFAIRTQAMNERYDLQLWIIEHMNDSFMSDQKWREMLPICRFADERYERFHRPLQGKWSCEYFVLRIIGEEYEENAPV